MRWANPSGLVHDRQQTEVGGGADDDRYNGFFHRGGCLGLGASPTVSGSSLIVRR